MAKKVIKGLKFNEFSAVDVPAHTPAQVKIEKAEKAGKSMPPELEKLKKALTVELYAYFWNIQDSFDVEMAVSKLIRIYETDLPAIARLIQAQAEDIDLSDVLPTEGAFVDLLNKSAKPNNKEVDMPPNENEKNDLQKQIDQLTKDKADLEAKVAKQDEELAKSKETSDPETPAEQVYKAADGVEYTGQSAILAKRLDDQNADNELTKRAAEMDFIPGSIETRKTILKAIDAVPDEKEREAALNVLKQKNQRLSKAFERVGDSGHPVDDDATKEFNKKVDGLPADATEQDIRKAFLDTHSDWKPGGDQSATSH